MMVQMHSVCTESLCWPCQIQLSSTCNHLHGSAWCTFLRVNEGLLYTDASRNLGWVCAVLLICMVKHSNDLIRGGFCLDFVSAWVEWCLHSEQLFNVWLCCFHALCDLVPCMPFGDWVLWKKFFSICLGLLWCIRPIDPTYSCIDAWLL